MDAPHCIGCPHHECRPDTGGICTEICTSCMIADAADLVEESADWFLQRAVDIYRVNPALVVEIFTGQLTFDRALAIATEVNAVQF